ncbi:hypothetical protein [Shouchella lehensis]|uniref:Uncharacterized protein n=1 Tax=Shouchella lehensis G1 TaxID=1246626 RepID=A0A060M5U6_9BACI|nr:hypothetical protein [Shouchella lehensis]AIC95454.1 hypothetical protein BleG1_2890 [Shouchella lehensis G1]
MGIERLNTDYMGRPRTLKEPIFKYRPRKGGNTTASVEQLLEDDNNYMVVQHHSLVKSLSRYLKSIGEESASKRILTLRLPRFEGLDIKNLIVDELPSDKQESYLFINTMQRLFNECNAVFNEGNIYINYSNGVR